jgi:hypothetical protein
MVTQILFFLTYRSYQNAGTRGTAFFGFIDETGIMISFLRATIVAGGCTFQYFSELVGVRWRRRGWGSRPGICVTQNSFTDGLRLSVGKTENKNLKII